MSALEKTAKKKLKKIQLKNRFSIKDVQVPSASSSLNYPTLLNQGTVYPINNLYSQ